MSYTVTANDVSPKDALKALKADAAYDHVPKSVKAVLEEILGVYVKSKVKLVQVQCYGHHPEDDERPIQGQAVISVLPVE